MTSSAKETEPRGERDPVFQSGVQQRAPLVIGEDADASILGRLHSAKSIDVDLGGLARIASLASRTMTPQPWTVDGDLFVSFRGGMKPLLHHGDLRVRGSLLIDDHAWLICTGNLIVDEILSDYRPSALAVGGNLSVPRLVMTGAVTALGSVKVKDVAFLREGAPPLSTAGEFETRTLLHYGPGAVDARSLIVSRSIDLLDRDQTLLGAPHLSADAMAPNGEFDAERCDRLLRCGLSLWR